MENCPLRVASQYSGKGGGCQSQAVRACLKSQDPAEEKGRTRSLVRPSPFRLPISRAVLQVANHPDYLSKLELLFISVILHFLHMGYLRHQNSLNSGQNLGFQGSEKAFLPFGHLDL